MKPIHLTEKEVVRSDNGYAVISRMQHPAGNFKVMAVRVEGSLGTPLHGACFTAVSDSKSGVPAAAAEVARWLAVMACHVPMADASRERATTKWLARRNS